MQGLLDIEQAAALIRQGHVLVVGGREELLTTLPRGRWIGGVANRLLTPQGACEEYERVYVYDFTEYLAVADIDTYQSVSREAFAKEKGAEGFAYAIIPAFSTVHRVFSMYAVTELANHQIPLVGWVAGMELGNEQMRESLVFNGLSGEASSDRFVVLQAQLKPTFTASVEVINPFEPGEGDVIVFPHVSFVVQECLVNGVERNFAHYWRETRPDPALPLVATIRGININVHVLAPCGENAITMAASVIPGVEYRFAKPNPNILLEYQQKASSLQPGLMAAIHCNANYSYLNLERKNLGSLQGVFSYGEIAYILMNQTTVLLRITPLH